jgi:hypothetical protein
LLSNPYLPIPLGLPITPNIAIIQQASGGIRAINFVYRSRIEIACANLLCVVRTGREIEEIRLDVSGVVIGAAIILAAHMVVGSDIGALIGELDLVAVCDVGERVL